MSSKGGSKGRKSQMATSKITEKITSTADVEVAETSGTSRTKQQVRPSSPLSPTRLTRMQEKLDLQNLNDRLATYIDRVRHLESENSRLTVQVQTTQETITREVTSIKSMYEQELSDARKLLDDTAKEKARVQIDASKWKNEAEELQAKFNKKEKDYATAEKRVHMLETMQSDMQTRVNQAIADKKRVEDELKEVTAERDKLAKQLAAAKAQLEDETLRRVDLENRIQSLKEELAFKQNVHEKEMSETRSLKQTEISEIDNRLKDHYEQKMADTLKELRDQYESQMRLNREEMESMYDTKFHDLQNNLDQQTNLANSACEEIRTVKSRFESMKSKFSELEAQNTSQQQRVKDLERMLEQERDWHVTAMQEKEKEIRELRSQMDQYIRDYQDLLDIKVALDLEIAAYRKLLEGEEYRLNITPVQSPSAPDVARSTPVRFSARGLKRKRTVVIQSEKKSNSDRQVYASAKGDIEIHEHDHEGKYVKIYNKGNKDASLGGWQLVRQAGGQETQFKFHRSIVIKANAYITVWGSSNEVTHNPPHDIVMKQQMWFVGDSMVTKLVHHNGEEMAVRESKKVSMSSLAERTRDTGSLSEPYVEYGDEELYHQQGDPENPQERCSIM